MSSHSLCWTYHLLWEYSPLFQTLCSPLGCAQGCIIQHKVSPTTITVFCREEMGSFMLRVLCRPATSCQQLEVTWWPWGTNAYYWSSSFSSLCEWSIVPSSVWLNCVSLGNSDIKHSGRNVYTSSPGKKQMPLALQFIAIIIPANSCKYRIKHNSVLTNSLSPLLQS